MKISVLREIAPGETRVAASPETVKKFIGLGAEVAVETGAGEVSSINDDDYAAAGAKIAKSASAAIKGADLILKVIAPSIDELSSFKSGQSIVSIVSPHGNQKLLKAAAKAGVDLFAMDLMPRITRAQSMDVLSSQSNLAGYKAVIDACAHYGKAMPMMMTAAGTIAPAKVFVMGAGVAGLQAIATARRLGAVVSATDVRFAAKEQVESLGASFVTVDEEAMKSAETSGGYAKEMSDDFKARQAEFVAEHIKKQNIVITTALIPGRPAPELVSEAMVRSMPNGGVVVDLAAEQGGNVAVTRKGEAVKVGGVTVIGFENFAGRLPADASALYARNVFNFVSTFFDKEKGAFPSDWDDEIVKGIALTRDGEIVHAQFADDPSPKTAEEPKATKKATSASEAKAKDAPAPEAAANDASSSNAATADDEAKVATTDASEDDNG